MERVLFAWLGMADLRAAQTDGAEGVGPIGQAVDQEPYGEVHLLSDHKAKDTGAYVNWVQRRTTSQVIVHKAKLPSPTHFGAIYEAAAKSVGDRLLWLQHEDVALDSGENGMIRVRAKTVGGEFWEPKTKRNRAVPISTTLRRYLDAYEQRLVPAQWYFPSPKGQRWDCDNFSRALRVANRKVGLEWSCLDYRHTFGSHLAMKGESLYKIGTLMGNSPEVCRRHYAALLPEALSETVEFGMPSEPELKLLG